jgi:hypothetical protein
MDHARPATLSPFPTVMLAFAWFWPDEKIFIWGVLPVPARILVIVTTLFALWSGFGGVAHFAHLGGYLGAFLYLRWLDRKRTAFKRQATAAPPDAVRRVAGYKAIDLASVHEVNREEINRILRQDQRAGAGIAHAAGGHLPLQLRPARRPGAAEHVIGPRPDPNPGLGRGCRDRGSAGRVETCERNCSTARACR